MNKITFKKTAFALSLVAITLAACESEDTFTPGAEPGVQDEGAYFYGSYTTEKIVEQGEEGTIKFEVCRTDTLSALDLPIVVDEKGAGLTLSESVHFEKGDSSAWLTVAYVGQALGTESKLRLHIADQYANPYMEKDGSTRLECNIISGQWVNVCDTCVFGPASGAWPDQGTQLQRLVGKKRMRFTNFLGSGQSLEFGLKSGWNDADFMQSKGEFNPITNAYQSSGVWYFMNQGNYEDWTPKGSSKTVSLMYFWEGADYTFIDLAWDQASSDIYKWGGKQYYVDLNHYSMMEAYIYYTDGTAGWEAIYVYLGHEKK